MRMLATLKNVAVGLSVLTLVLCGCQPSRLSQRELERQSLSQIPGMPMKSYVPTEQLVACLGRQLSHLRTGRVIVGPSGADSSGKTGVDVVTLTRAVLNHLREAGADIAVSPVGVPSVRPNGQQSAPEDVMWPYQGPRASTVQLPDLFFEVTITSVNQVHSRQRSIGASGRDIDAAASASNSVQRVYVHFYLRDARTQLDLAVIDLEVQYQEASQAADVGAYVTAVPQGKKRGAGLRIGMSSAISDSAEPAIRVAIETAAVLLLAEYFNADIADCPAAPAPAGERLRKDARPAIDQIADFWETLTPVDRILNVQSALYALGYQPGRIDGLVGRRTRSAIQQFERDHGLPGYGGEVTLQVFVEIARERIARGEDIRLPARERVPGSGGVLRILLPEPRTFKTGTNFTARVASDRGGFLTCYWGMPAAIQAVLPILGERGSSITARKPAAVPAPSDRLALADAGDHYLHCMVTATAVALPEDLAPGRELPWMPAATFAQRLRAAAGAEFVAEATERFTVNQ